MAGNPFDDLIPRPGTVQNVPKQDPTLLASPIEGTQVVGKDLGVFAQPRIPAVAAPSPPPPEPGGFTDPQQYAEIAKGVIPGAIKAAGSVLQAPDVVAARGQQGASAFGRGQIDVMDRIDRGESVPEMEDAGGYQHMSPEQRAAYRAESIQARDAFAPSRVQDRALYKTGEAIQDYAKTVLPAAPGYENAFGRQVGEGMGSLLLGLPAGFLGTLPAATVYGSMGVGEATQRAVEYDAKERAAGRDGLSQTQITSAGLLGVGPGTTDVLPVEVLLGRLPVRIPEALRRPLAQAIARIGTQAAIEGVQEGGQSFLQDLIAREVYNPNQVLGANFKDEAAVGAGVGGLAEFLKTLGAGAIKSAAGRRGGHTSASTTAESTSTPQIPGAERVEPTLPWLPPQSQETPPAVKYEAPAPTVANQANPFADLVPANQNTPISDQPWVGELADSIAAEKAAPDVGSEPLYAIQSTPSRVEYEARALLDDVRKFEDRLRKDNQPPETIADAINARYGTAVTPNEIVRGDVWWRPASGAAGANNLVTGLDSAILDLIAEQEGQHADLPQPGATDVGARPLEPQRMRGVSGEPSAGPRLSAEQRQAAIDLAAKGLNSRQIADHLSNQSDQYVRRDLIEQAISGAQEKTAEQRRADHNESLRAAWQDEGRRSAAAERTRARMADDAYRQRWSEATGSAYFSPAMVERLASPEMRGLTAAKAAEAINAEFPGSNISAASLRDKRLALGYGYSGPLGRPKGQSRTVQTERKWTDEMHRMLASPEVKSMRPAEAARAISEAFPAAGVITETAINQQRHYKPAAAFTGKAGNPKLNAGKFDWSAREDGRSPDQRLVELMESAPNPAARAEALNAEFGGPDIPRITAKATIKRWHRIRDAALRAQGSEPMFAAGAWDPRSWLDWIKGNPNVEQQSGSPAESGQGRAREGAAVPRQQSGADASREDGDGSAGASGSDRRHFPFQVGTDLMARFIDGPPNAKGLSQRDVVVRGKNNWQRNEPNTWIAKARISEVEPGVWTLNSLQVRRNKQRSGIGSQVLDAVESQIGEPLVAPQIMTPQLYNFWRKREMEGSRWATTSVDDYVRYRNEFYSPDKLRLQRDLTQYALENAPKGSIEQNLARKELRQLDDLVEKLPPEEDMMAAIQAFHGSPHDFDQFSMDKIGTGEGAQAFGHGLYFAENELVAKSYQDALKPDSPNRLSSATDRFKHLELDGKPIGQQFDIDPAYVDEFKAKIAAGEDIRPLLSEKLSRWQQMADDGSYPFPQYAKDKVAAYRGLIDRISNGGQLRDAGAGRLYEVKINADPEHFLDWDRPIGKQNPDVIKALREGYKKAQGVSDRYLDNEFLPNRSLQDAIGGGRISRSMSEALKEQGIPGIRYLDQGSRGVGVGSRNIVVFDPSIVEIVAKDGKPVTPQQRNDILAAHAGGTDASVKSSPARNPRVAALAAVTKMNRPVVIPRHVVDGIHEALAPSLGMVPEGLSVGVLSRIAPLKGIKGADAMMTFTEPDGSSFEVPVVLADIIGTRAITIPDLGAVGFVRFDLAGDLGRSLRGELGHELVHVLRRQDDFAAADWSRLLAQGNALGVLDSEYRTYLHRIGNAHYNTMAPGITGRQLYEQLYRNQPRAVLKDRLDQETVAHMLELYSHGEFIPAEVEKVRDLLDAILDGSLARGVQGVQQGEMELLGAAQARQTANTIPQRWPNWEKWGVRAGTPKPMGGEVQIPLLKTDGTASASVNFHDEPDAVYIEGLLGGKRSGDARGQASRAVKAIIEYASAQGKPVIATKTEGARNYWGLMGFRHEGINSVFDDAQMSRLATGDINSTIWGHERGYGNAFESTYGPGASSIDGKSAQQGDSLAAVQRNRLRDQDSLGYYSKLDEVLGSLGPKDKVTAATLQQKGVKLAEIEARGLSDLLLPRGHAEALKLYRGVPAGRDPKSKDGTTGGALFMSPDEAVAKMYAGDKGNVAREDVSFRNLLVAKNWFEAKQALGLPMSTTMDGLIKAAAAAGHDGMSFATTNGREYVKIEPSKSVPVSDLLETAGRNRVEVRESGKGKTFEGYYVDPLTWGGYHPHRKFGSDLAAAEAYAREVGLTSAHVQELHRADTKWHNYSLDPKNPSYRETVIHLPVPDRGVKVVRHPEYDDAFALQRPDGSYFGNDHEPIYAFPDRGEAERSIRHGGAYSDDPVFRSGHFAEPNIVGHMMTSMVRYRPNAKAIADIHDQIKSATRAELRDRSPALQAQLKSLNETNDGGAVYLVDQIQSDWGQKVRDQGGSSKAEQSERAAKVRAELASAKAAHAGFDRTAHEAMRDEIRKLDEIASSKPGMFRSQRSIESARDQAAELRKMWQATERQAHEINRLEAELESLNIRWASGHPLVNTTDQWTNTTLRRALRQAAEADAAYIAIPSGDTVLSYNPGDTEGMRGFYDKIVPKNLRNLLQKIDKASPDPQHIDQLDTPTSGLKGKGFTLFPLTDKVKAEVLDEGQPLFAFGGINAKTADKEALDRAKEMEATAPPRVLDPTKPGYAAYDAHRSKVWDATHWFLAPDGKWKHDIDDSGARFTHGDDRVTEFLMRRSGVHPRTEKYEPGSLGASIVHDKLYKAYPDMPGMALFESDGEAQGTYEAANPKKTWQTEGIGINPSAINKLSTGLHEMQHAVQAREGFGYGTSPEAAFSKYLNLYNELGDAAAVFNRVAHIGETFDQAIAFVARVRQIQPGSLRSLVESYGSYEDILRAQERLKQANGNTVSPHEWYRKHAGEVEARAVQRRRNLTEDERRARPPWVDYDVPEHEQIVTFNKTGPAQAFGTVQSPDANITAYSQAVIMTKRGESPEKIWDETGWFKDNKGKWKFWNERPPIEQSVAESKAHARRMAMSDDERRATPPWRASGGRVDVPSVDHAAIDNALAIIRRARAN